MLRAVAARRPRQSFTLARALAYVTLPLSRQVTAAQVRTVFSQLDDAAAKRVRRSVLATSLGADALHAALEQGGKRPLYPEVRPNEAIATLRPPLILATFHLGPLAALGPVLMDVPGHVLALHRHRWPNRIGLDMLEVGDGEWGHARSLLRAVETLREGGSVFAVLDEDDATTIDAPLLGRTVALARGAFALARMTGTPIVPLAIRWRGSAVEVTFGEPISEATEAEMAAAATAWLERYLIESPGEITARTFALLGAADGAREKQGAQLPVPDLSVGGPWDRPRRDHGDPAGGET
jgi:lauroyl/myristoyl acyltransferase